MKIVIGLGANLGDRLATLREAAERIGRIAPIASRSRVWETKPVGCSAGDGDFLNAAVLVEWSRDPLALLDALLLIEADLGRERGSTMIRNAPRTIDLDILWIDGGVIVDAPPRLVVPHPRLGERAFAIAPLLDVAPQAPFELPASDPDRDAIRMLDVTL